MSRQCVTSTPFVLCWCSAFWGTAAAAVLELANPGGGAFSLALPDEDAVGCGDVAVSPFCCNICCCCCCCCKRVCCCCCCCCIILVSFSSISARAFCVSWKGSKPRSSSSLGIVGGGAGCCCCCCPPGEWWLLWLFVGRCGDGEDDDVGHAEGNVNMFSQKAFGWQITCLGAAILAQCAARAN